MKKPLMATLGLAGACVACCTLPLALPLLGGTFVGGLAGLYGWSGGAVPTLLAAALVGTAAVGLALWRRQRSRRAACPATPAGPAGPAEGRHCATVPQAGACGCGPTT